MFAFMIALCAFTVIGVVSSESPTDFIFSPCPKDDSHCLKLITRVMYARIIKGNKNLGIEPLDPWHIREIEGNFSDIHYSLKNNTVLGFSKCQISQTELANDTLGATLKLHCPVLKLTGQYFVNGTLLDVPLNEQGNYKINFHGEDLTVMGNLKKSDDVRHVSFTNLTIIPNLIKGVDIDVENLVNGQVKFTEPALQFMRTNWQPFAKAIQTPIINQNYMHILQAVNNYIKNVPAKDIISA